MARRMRFGTWCKKDIDDNTKIIYTFRMTENDGTEHTENFTSEDAVPWSWLERIRYAWIDKIERDQDAWIVTIYE